MTTQLPGPIVVYGGYYKSLGTSTVPTNYTGIDNDNIAPSAFLKGVATLDIRFGPYGGTNADQVIPSWAGTDYIHVLAVTPTAASATNIAAAQVPVSGTAMTLAGASTSITVLASALSFPAGANGFPAGARIIEGNPALFQGGSAQFTGPLPYDPTTLCARCLQFTSVGDDHLGTVAVVGIDTYGYTVHETVTLTNASVVVSKKALKGVVSLTPGGTLSGSNLSVGVSDTFGIPLSVSQFPFVAIYWDDAFITSKTGFTTRSLVTSAATTADVRGTYALQSASDGVKQLVVFVTPRQTLAGLVGLPQF